MTTAERHPDLHDPDLHDPVRDLPVHDTGDRPRGVVPPFPHPAGCDRPVSVDAGPTWLHDRLAACAVEELPTAALVLDGSPRIDGEDSEHTRALADVGAALPPIVVQRGSLRVIDGRHRVLAARSEGRGTIRARLFDGDEREAYLLAVGLNVRHGLPLTRADRLVAAERVAATHPEWSDRMIAGATGLGAGAVVEVRQRVAPEDGDRAARIGRDGRVRPINSAAGRELAGKLLRERPAASLRAVAREAGVSPSTVHDVRKRLDAGEDLVPHAHRRPRDPAGEHRADPSPGAGEGVDVHATMAVLRDDPTLRFSQTGRGLLRWLEGQVRTFSHSEVVAGAVPEHCTGLVAQLARSYSRAWDEFAVRLERGCDGDG